MDKLEKLLARCKCGVFLTVNEHRDYYQSVEERIEELREDGRQDFSDEDAKAMIASGNIVQLHFYPDNPMSFYCIHRATLDEALNEALKCLRLGGGA